MIQNKISAWMCQTEGDMHTKWGRVPLPAGQILSQWSSYFLWNVAFLLDRFLLFRTVPSKIPDYVCKVFVTDEQFTQIKSNIHAQSVQTQLWNLETLKLAGKVQHHQGGAWEFSWTAGSAYWGRIQHPNSTERHPAECKAGNESTIQWQLWVNILDRYREGVSLLIQRTEICRCLYKQAGEFHGFL